MIKSYFTVMLRNIIKQKFYAAINILCLTVGITFALLIGTFVWGELQVNKSLKDVDRLYLMENNLKSSVSDFAWFVPGHLSRQAIETYPSLFEDYYRFWDRNITVSKGDKHFRIQSMIGDPSFLTIFGFPVLHGDANTSLREPNSIVITQKTAIQFFNKTDVVGETLSLSTEKNGVREYKITAVVDNPQGKNSVSDFMNMDARIFLSLENIDDFLGRVDPDQWQSDIISYIKLKKGASADEATITLNRIFQKDAPKSISENRVISLSPLKDYYRLTNHGAVQKLVVSLSVVVLFIVLLAMTNFINISIASSFSRFKEVGIRKVIGGVSKQVVIQFILESVMLAFFSGVVSLLLYESLHSYFSQVLNSPLPSVVQFSLWFWLSILAGILLIGILAGLYPAIYQSLAKPIESLKGKFKSVKGSIQFSRVLVGTQFLITIFIFVGAVILSSQVSYFLGKDLGYDKSHVLIVSSVPRLWDEAGFQRVESAKQEFLKSSKINSVSLSWGAPAWNLSPTEGRMFHAGGSIDTGVRTTVTCSDEDYLKVFDIKLLEGSYLNAESPSRQANTIVINETAQKALDITIGDKMQIEGGKPVTVIGVIKDFNFESLQQKVKPLAMMHNRDFQAYRYYSFRLTSGNLTESVAEVERLWKKVFPNDPCDFSFADERLEKLYATELQMRKAATIATVLMMVIVFTGVLGLVSLSVSKRNKEIGIRKVLGASVSNILALLSREYVMLVTSSFVVAMPLIYFVSNRWLEGFAYRIELSWWMFALPVAVLFVVIVLIVCVQSLKTALANPVKSLRYE